MTTQISKLKSELNAVNQKLKYRESLAVVGEVMAIWDKEFEKYLNELNDDQYKRLQDNVNEFWRKEGDTRSRQKLNGDLSLFHVTKYAYDSDEIDSILKDFESKQGWSLKLDKHNRRICDKVVKLKFTRHDVSHARNERVTREQIEECLRTCCKKLEFDTSEDDIRSMLSCLPQKEYPLDTLKKRRP